MKKLGLILVVLAMLLVGCGKPAVEVVMPVEVTRIVEVEVTRIVEVDAICIEETALPSSIATSTPTLVWLYWTPTPTDAPKRQKAVVSTPTTWVPPAIVCPPPSIYSWACTHTGGMRHVTNLCDGCFWYKGPVDECGRILSRSGWGNDWCRANAP